MFYRSFYEAIKEVPKKHRAVIYEAVFEYVFESKEPSISGVPSALWKLIRPQLDASSKRYENSKKGAAYGKLGGRPRKNADEEKPLKGHDKKPLKGNESKTLNVNSNSNSNSNVNVNCNSASPDNTNNIAPENPNKPSNAAIAAEVFEKGYKLTGESINSFVEYNDERGWQGDWKKHLKQWAEREWPEKPKKQKNKFLNFDQHDNYDDDAINRMHILNQINSMAAEEM